MLAASLNAFFCASPIYGSAEDFRLSQNFTVSREVTPAAKQQIGETRKKCNSDDRRQWRKQGGAVGAAASRMRAAAKQTLGAATRLSAATSFFSVSTSPSGSERGEQPLSRGSSASKSLVVFWFSFDIKREPSALMKERSGPREAQSHLTERIKPAPRTGARRWCFSGSLLARKRELNPA